jgi:hypothetical protein
MCRTDAALSARAAFVEGSQPPFAAGHNGGDAVRVRKYVVCRDMPFERAG